MGSIKCLNLCFLLHTKNYRVIGWVHVQANNIDDLKTVKGFGVRMLTRYAKASFITLLSTWTTSWTG